MADVALQSSRTAAAQTARKQSGLRNWLNRKSTIAFLMALPLILLIAVLVVYPAFYALHLATLNKSIDRKSTRLNSSHIQKSRMPSSA